MPTTILQEILACKAKEIAARADHRPLAELRRQCETCEPPRGFAAALQQQLDRAAPAIIAEIKKASPSKGLLRQNFAPAQHAADYAAHGATCLSVLTDSAYFQGCLEDLGQARAACSLPLLRKDFIIDHYQIYEARQFGADAILLIVAALGDPLLRELCDLASSLGLDVLVEVHNGEELARALSLPTPLLGINNRNLHTFATHLETTIDLAPSVPADRIIITESGIHHPHDVARMRAHHIHAFLVGEACMRAVAPGAKLAELFAPPA